MLLVLVLLVTVGSFLVLRALNMGVQRSRDDQSTTAASLVAAERALLGYATRYPDDPTITSATAGPGHLPCPDTRFDAGDVPGQADPPCARSSATETGLLPWRTLDIAAPRDADGAPLWYAVADAYRNNPVGIVNPSTPAGLRLDDCAAGARQIAALVFAPRGALSGQDRSTASAAVRYNAVNYLEGQNASRGDGCFTSATSPIANDFVRVIERAALMRAVQRRVLADVANALARYYADPDGDDVAGVDPDCAAAALPADCDNALPWLSPYADPTTSTWRGVVGTRAGQLPLRIVDVDFPATFGAAWQIPVAGVVTTTGSTPPDPACVRSTSAVCSTQPSGFLAPASYRSEVRGSGVVPFGAGICRWRGGRAMRCRTTQTILDPGGSGTALLRTYVVEIDGLPRRLAPPSASAPRLEDVTLVAATLATDASIALTVSDTLVPVSGASTELGLARLTLGAAALVDSFALVDVPCDLEVDDDGIIDPPTRRAPGELPRWFTANDWQQFIAVAYAAAYAPGNAAADCTDGVDCLQLQRARHGAPAAVLNDVQGIVLGGGPALATQTRPSADPAQVFEGENASFDDRYETRDPASDFNDQVSRLTTDD